ncbi:hypothetical protein BP6252_07330 [Coleophoma cylindrospora]|uniref:F-box domain-containing protein n=1 Tax=Coleophoma cylindrospora TaxID=1849047 RepID=A0A3D8RH89_9HELO|nr:hypothetical protein BP6252_07330 [Coleophoma cylindrospora]
MDVMPPEILRILINSTEQADLPSLRLTSKALSSPATARQFEKIHVTPFETSLASYTSIITDSNLSAYVRTVKFTTSEDPNDDDRSDANELELPEDYENALTSVNQFPNLKGIEMEFSIVCSSPSEENWYLSSAAESIDFRFEVLKSLISALNSPQRSGLRSLSLKNLQNFNDERLVNSPDFLATLSSLSELRLKIVTQYIDSSPENNWSLPEMHQFFKELPDVWLKPAAENLESLTIHADTYWGYIPKSDFRSLKFPKLRRLELGNYVFSHDWQLEWILSHGETLEELILDDCPIVSYTYNYGSVDDENYPVNPLEDTAESYQCEYTRSWSHFFTNMKEKLPKLKHFKMGSGDWDEGKNFDGAKWKHIGLTHHSKMPDDPYYGDESYMGFDRGTGPSPWLTLKSYAECVDDRETPQAVLEKGSFNAKEDEDAYQALLDTIQTRS